MERLGNVWVSQLMQVQGMSEVSSGGIGRVRDFFPGKIGQELDNVYTPRKQTWTPRIHIVERKLLWYHVISSSYFVESSQSTYQNWPFAGLSWWISCGYMNTHTHTRYITLSRSMKTLQNRWYIYPTTWHDRGPASNPTVHREFGLIISHKLDLSWPFNLAIPRVVGSKLPIIR